MKIKKNTINSKLLLVGIFSVFSLYGFCQKTVRVSTIDELFEAIASNTTVELEEGNYDISKLDSDKKTNSVKIEKTETLVEGPFENQLIISGVSNLKIIGIGKKKSKIYTPSSGVVVLFFKNCKNITLDNIDVGHKTKETSFGTAVIVIIESEIFTIKNSYIYNSFSGIVGNNVKKLSIIKTTITECSNRLLHLDNCVNAVIDSCILSKNRGGIELRNCLNLTISNTEISDNVENGYMDEVNGIYSNSYLININACANIKLIKCVFEHNDTSYLVKSSQSINLDAETDFKDNKFIGTFEN